MSIKVREIIQGPSYSWVKLALTRLKSTVCESVSLNSLGIENVKNYERIIAELRQEIDSLGKASPAKPTICPFNSTDDVLELLEYSPCWSKMNHKIKPGPQETKRCRDSLQKKFHPDKIISWGCPKDYGNAVSAKINLKYQAIKQ